ATFCLSLLLAFVLTRYVRNFASARGWVAVPSHERHLHSTPLPRLGGVAIFISFCASIAAGLALALHNPRLYSVFPSKTLLTVLAPACLVFLLGVYVDIRGAEPYVNFSSQAFSSTRLFL